MATKKIVPKAVAPKTGVSIKPASKKKVVAKTKAIPSVGDKKSGLQKQIEVLQAQMESLDQETVQELKLKISDTKKVLREYEQQLELLTGKPVVEPKTRRERRPSITDDALKDQLLKALAHHGETGMNAKQLAEKVEQDPLRIRKYIATNPKALKRIGKGAGTKFFLP